MFAIKGLNNVLGNESALPQQGQETSVSESLTEKDKTSTDKEKEDEVKIEETTETRVGDGDLAFEPTKIEVEKGEDDDSTTAISEASSSTHEYTENLAGDHVVTLLEASYKINETKYEIMSKEVVTGAIEQCLQNCIDEDENKEDGEENSPSLILAQRMKEIFDSSSPDEPSNAFGKSAKCSPVNLEPPKSVSLAKDMKKMFEFPSPDQPSGAFSVGKTSVDNPKEVTTSSDKLHCKTETTVQEVERKIESAKATSPTSVADLMVSMLWASSSPTKRSMVTDQDSTKQGVDTVQDPNHAVIREAVIEEENESDHDIEEITVEDENENDVRFDEIIEEITVEDDEDREDGISVATNEKFFENKAYIEVSSDFVELVETEECDGCSYDEITADDWEYDEKTVDEEVLLADQENDARSRQKAQATEVIVGAESKPSMEPSNCGNQLRTSENPKHNVESSVAMASTVLQTIHTSKKSQQNNYIDGSKVEKLYPRIARTRSTAGKLSEKLKMFDSPKSMEGQSSLVISKKSWQKSKPIPQIKSPREESNKDSKRDKGINPKTPVVLPALWSTPKQVVRLGETPLADTSRHDLEDNTLVEKIVSMVKEPGAMQNKHALAERITSLLTGKSKDTGKTSTLVQQSHSSPLKIANFLGNNSVTKARSSPPPKIIECPSPGSKHSIGADSYLNRINDEAMDPGLKQMRKDVKVQKENLKHVDDPDMAANRSVKRIGITDRKDEEEKKPTNMKPGFEKKQKAVDPEEIMARIWPKNRHEGESKAKISLEIMTPESRKVAPRKLGNRLKMFESPLSSNMSASKTASCVEKNSMIEPHKPHMMNKNSRNEMKVDNRTKQIGKETVQGLLTFQRLWRKKNSKRSTQATDKDVPVSKIETKTTAKCPNSSDSTKKCYYSLTDLEQGDFDRNLVDMERWEEFLSDESFNEHFGLTKEDFYQQPKWKRNNQKRKVRIAF